MTTTMSMSSSRPFTSASEPSISFSGTLSGSFNYERKTGRLPPVDPDHLAGQSRRRLAANVAVRDSQVVNIDEARQHSHKMAQRRSAEMESFRLIDSIRESEARTARRSLLSARSSWLTTMEGHQSKSEQSLREAVRETARECVRKEELKKRKAAARQATELANKRAEEFVFQAKEARKFQDMKTRQEQEWLQRKIDFEDLRHKRQLSNDFERVAEREQGGIPSPNPNLTPTLNPNPNPKLQARRGERQSTSGCRRNVLRGRSRRRISR